MDVATINDLDWWESSNGKGGGERRENGKMVMEKLSNGNERVTIADKWENSSASSSGSNSSHFDFSSNTGEYAATISYIM